MDQAIIFAHGKGIDGVELDQATKTSLVGVNQLVRLIIIAQRAGINKFIIVSDPGDSKLIKNLCSDRRINSEIEIHPYGNSIELDPNNYLVLQSNLVITPQNINSLIDRSKIDITNAKGNLLLIERSDEKCVKLNGDNIEEGFIDCGKALGAFVGYGKNLEKLVDSSICINSYIKENINSGQARFVSIPEGGYWYHLKPGSESAKTAEEILFSNVGKTATGWISRNINSKFSLPTSSILVKTPLTPNMISVLINIIGMLSGPFLAFGHPVLGAFLMHLATILDRCDGEVARVKLMESKRGQWVDTISDQFTVFSFFVGLTIGYYRLTDSIVPIVLGVFNLSVFIFFLIWSFYYLKNYTSSGSLVSYFTVDKYDSEKSSLVRRFILFLRPMSRRNFYSLGFLVVSIIGGYPWMLGFLSFAMLLFLIHLIEDIININKFRNNKNKV